MSETKDLSGHYAVLKHGAMVETLERVLRIEMLLTVGLKSLGVKGLDMIPDEIKPSDRRRSPVSSIGKDAREAVIEWLQGPAVADWTSDDFFDSSADSLLAWLWREGFKIVPLDTDITTGDRN